MAPRVWRWLLRAAAARRGASQRQLPWEVVINLGGTALISVTNSDRVQVLDVGGLR